jgi:hypothetical protein
MVSFVSGEPGLERSRPSSSRSSLAPRTNFVSTITTLTGVKAVVVCTVVLSFFTLHLLVGVERAHGAPGPRDDAPSAAGASFSACILWMDDNYRLDEWLAYHYYVMTLRYVVVNVDPRSRTSPQPIVDRWNDAGDKYRLGMTIVTMTDAEYVPDFDRHVRALEKQEQVMLAKNNSQEEATYGRMKTTYHRMRQPEFYKACSRHLIERNKSW